MIRYRPVLYIIGILLTLLAVIMLIPAVVDLFSKNDNWVGFFISAFLTAFVGIAITLTNHEEKFSFNIKQMFILTSASWLTIAAFSALPFLFSELKLSYTDAFFEAMSGLTTTGATVLVGLDYMPKGILLWRSMLSGIGAVGIIVFVIAIAPMLRIGGMQIFKTESDKSDKAMSRVTQVTLAVTSVYLLFVSLCALALLLAGMNIFDAINHSFTILATTGFSTHDAGFAFYDNASIDYIVTLFMIISGMPFILYVHFLRGDRRSFYKDEQVRWYFRILCISIFIVAIWLHFHKDYSWLSSIRHAAFNVTSMLTTSGFAGSSDYTKWGGFIDVVLFMLCIIGGCTGGTAGGIKIFRLQVLYKSAKIQLVQLLQPHAVLKMRYNGKAIPDSIIASVMSFTILYCFAFMIVALILSFCGLDFISSISLAAAGLSNTAHGLGSLVGPVGNYSILPDLGKWALAFAMLLGRLEIFTILVLFSSKFWKD